MNIPTVPNDPISRFALAIFKVNGLLLRNGDRITRSIGQSSARWQVLGRVGHHPQTVAHIARDMGHARQSVQRIADVLAKEGLVTYVENPKDQRTQLVELTATGSEVLATIYALNEAWSQSILTRLDPEQLVKLANGLEGIAQILEADEQNQETHI